MHRTASGNVHNHHSSIHTSIDYLMKVNVPMTSRHRRPTSRPLVVTAAGAGLVGALALTGPAPGLVLKTVANTIIVVGGNGDPTSAQEVERLQKYMPLGDRVVPIAYAADVGIGFPGLPPLSIAGRDTYAGSVEDGSTKTAAEINNARANGGDVTVYALSLGTDVVGVALVKAGPKKETDGKLTVVEHGGPSFVNSGIWNMVPPLIPGLRTGPVAQGDQGSGADKVVSVCIKGDSICGLGADPIPALFYFLPGFDLHGKDYTAEKIAKYSPDGGVEFTPGANAAPKAEKDGASTTETRDGHVVTVQKYKDGTVTKTWEQDGTTWVVIDTGQNPWGRLARANGIPLPAGFDTVLNSIMPVPEPGERGTLSLPMQLWQQSATAAQAALDEIVERTVDAGTGRHAVGNPGTVAAATLLDEARRGGDRKDEESYQAPKKNDPPQQEDSTKQSSSSERMDPPKPQGPSQEPPARGAATAAETPVGPETSSSTSAAQAPGAQAAADGPAIDAVGAAEAPAAAAA
ncbi:PE-PPE domain-containing protein [Tsukamurella sputi]|nr:PE-PPE domain-containing protein [Tsukamurella sputi]